MGTLYLVATPIGNLEDITLRALRVLKEATLIAAEDTRAARKLLSHFEITKPITSYFEHNKIAKLETILNALARDFRVVPIPGANALTTALIASGLPTDQFIFLGFLPRQKSARRKFLQSVADEPRTLIAYEAPHRVRASLDDIAATLGNRAICVARELTKLYEEFFRGTIEQARAHFAAHAPRGEFTFVIAGKTTDDRQQTTDQEWDGARVIAAVRELIAAGVARTDAVKRVARESGRERREVYQLAMNK